MDDKIIVMFKRGVEEAVDIEIPREITSIELINALNTAYNLGIRMDDPEDMYLRSDNPIALIRGEATMEELGIRNGSTIYFDR